MPSRGTETEFELTTIERLEQLGYNYVHGSELDRDETEVVLRDRLEGFLRRRYPDFPDDTIQALAGRYAKPEGIDTIHRNKTFHKDLTRGFNLHVKYPDGRSEDHHVYAIDWDDPTNNDFLVVNQLKVKGKNDRRPDLVVYVNGLPLVVFELKNPYSEDPTVEEAINQLFHYRNDIPQLFDYNALAVASDGSINLELKRGADRRGTLLGMWSSGAEWFTPWKSITGESVEPNSTGSMKTLIEGLFTKDWLLEYIRHYIVFEVANEKITKKGALYHQFFAVRKTVRRTIEAYETEDKRIGVIWHTTGSGKSLSMTFLVGILRQRPELQNPGFVIQVDRTDLDDQLHDQFVAARSLVGDVKHADSVDELRTMLQTEGGEVVFSTIEKFRLKDNGVEGEPEVEHPVLSERRNIIVIADEAHRSQYGFQRGFARSLQEALPNAMRLGFTGTPISFHSADTQEVFGTYIDTYDIKQSQEDGATVPIHYEPRQIKISLATQNLDEDLDDVVEDMTPDELEKRKPQWAALAKAAGAKDRLETLAKDLLDHFASRTETLAGKGMIVCMTRENAVGLFDAMTALPNCPEVKVVMTGDITKDPEEWNKAGHISTKAQRDAIKERIKDPDDPLQLVIVVDMWLTGTDIPPLHTLYIDKPMKGHTIIQAISRVNRVFRDKPHGLVVDYIGIGDELREATATYQKGSGRGDPAPEVGEETFPIFEDALKRIREMLPDKNYGQWRHLSRIELEDLHMETLGHLTDLDDLREDYLQAEHRLTHSYVLVKHLDKARPFADEVWFYQTIRKQVMKTIPGAKPDKDIERAVKDLVDEGVQADDVVDIFALAGIDNADISILDDEFLQTFKDKPFQNLRLKLLEKLVRDQIKLRRKKNLAKAKSFQKLLEETLQKYHDRLIDAAAVIRAMIEINQQMETDDQRAADLGLDEQELAFYDAVADAGSGVYDDELLRDLIHQVVGEIKKNLKVDWTKPHREQIRARVVSAVKRTLHKNKIKPEDFDKFTNKIIEQAVELFHDWPTAA